MGSEPNPYAAPQAAAPTTISGVGFPVYPYASGVTRANWIMGLMGLGLLVDLAFMVFEAWELGLLIRAQGGEEIAEEYASFQSAMAVIGGFQFLILIPSVVAFLMWFHRAYRNLPALGARNLQFTPAWAAGYFFIPILNLFRPYQAAREIWIASDPEVDATAEDGGWRSGSASPVVGLWWLMWIFSGIVAWGSIRLAVSEDLSILIAAAWTGLASSALGILAALFAIAMIRRIAINQEEKIRRFGDAAADSPG